MGFYEGCKVLLSRCGEQIPGTLTTSTQPGYPWLYQSDDRALQFTVTDMGWRFKFAEGDKKHQYVALVDAPDVPHNSLAKFFEL